MKAKGLVHGVLIGTVCLGAVFLSACAGSGGTTAASDAFMASVVISAPAETVFNYVADVQHLSEWHPGSYTNLQGQGLGGTFEWFHDLGETSLRGQTVVVDYIPNQKIGEYFMGDSNGYLTPLFLPVAEGTKVIAAASYHMEFPQPIKADEAAFKRMVREGWRQDLQKLKAAVEKR